MNPDQVRVQAVIAEITKEVSRGVLQYLQNHGGLGVMPHPAQPCMVKRRVPGQLAPVVLPTTLIQELATLNDNLSEMNVLLDESLDAEADRPKKRRRG